MIKVLSPRYIKSKIFALLKIQKNCYFSISRSKTKMCFVIVRLKCIISDPCKKTHTRPSKLCINYHIHCLSSESKEKPSRGKLLDIPFWYILSIFLTQWIIKLFPRLLVFYIIISYNGIEMQQGHHVKKYNPIEKTFSRIFIRNSRSV